MPFVHVIESPSPADLLDGRTEGRVLWEALRLADIAQTYSLATNRETLELALTTRLTAAWKQHNEFGRHTDLSFGNPDWVALAESFDWSGARCDESQDLLQTLEAAFRVQGPSLIVIPIDYRENVLLTERLGNIACPI